MPTLDQNEWLTTHIPHRVRAAIARLDTRGSILRVYATIDPEIKPTFNDPEREREQRIYWHCAKDAIWEGRLTATRWLIEFIGIVKRGNGPWSSISSSNRSTDARITDIDGFRTYLPTDPDAAFLADVWQGCSQGASHATDGTNHPPVNQQELVRALTIVVAHLQSTIFDFKGLKLRNHVLKQAG